MTLTNNDGNQFRHLIGIKINCIKKMNKKLKGGKENLCN